MDINIHYDGRVDKCVPVDASSVLDVGCGDGFLAAGLSQRIPHVVAVDVDQPVLERAKQRFPTAAVVWRHGDIREVSAELPGARVSLSPLGRVFVHWQARRPRRADVPYGSASRGPSTAR